MVSTFQTVSPRRPDEHPYQQVPDAEAVSFDVDNGANDDELSFADKGPKYVTENDHWHVEDSENG